MPRFRPVYIAAIAALGLLTCDSLSTFDISESGEATIPQGGVVSQLLGAGAFTGFGNLDLTQTSEWKNQGINKNELKSVKVYKLTLTVTQPGSGQDLTFLSSVKFYINASGQPQQLIADGSNFPAGTSTVGLNVYDVELTPYVAAPSMSITTDAQGTPPNQDTTIRANVILNVDVNLKNAICH